MSVRIFRLCAVLVAVLLLAPLLAREAAAARTIERPRVDRVQIDKVVYPGHGVDVWRASGQLHRLSETSLGFRRAIRASLDRTWGWSDDDPDCAQAPVATVKEYRARVAFVENLGMFSGGPGDAPEKCARGGAWQFFVKRNGHWIFPYRLGGQDVPGCRMLRHSRIPRMNGATECVNGKGEIVPYRP
ncbi:hypothetical protein GCM10022242_11060 [Nocardioides panacisoli]|uniref:Secreted protein n=1 Tax=Nocardioides panacisoli TaxID=627624 RepID=A0ABP7I2D4_9ACTN